MQVDDGSDFLWGLIVGLVAGMAIQTWLRARRSVRFTKGEVRAAKRAFWRIASPRLLLWGFVAACAAVAAIRLTMGGTAP